MHSVQVGWALGLLLLVLAIAASILMWRARLGDWRAPLTAATRATAQLAGVSLVIGLVLRSLVLTFLFIALMALIAAATSARRISGSFGAWSAVLLLPIAGGVVGPVAAAILIRVVPLHPIAVLPVAGILIGGAMSATTLSGRLVRDELTGHWDLFEAALALGLTRRQAVDIVGRPVASSALVPGLDQTRTVGLVTLPGAFVGVLLAGASPVQAGAAQLLVLVSLLVVQVTAASLTVELISAGRVPINGHRLPR